MTSGVVWSLVAALGFGFTQTFIRKSNLLVGATRATFGLLLSVEVVLVTRTLVVGDYRRLTGVPLRYPAFFVAAVLIHHILGWTLLTLSQRQIGVARTGAVASTSPLVGALLAAVFLNEALTVWTLLGVALSMTGVALVSTSRPAEDGRSRWVFPLFGLAVAMCWGTSPMLIRKGLVGIDAPLVGLTLGLGVALTVHAIGMTLTGSWRRETWDRRALPWMALAGFTGALGIGAQWVAFGLTTIAIAITVQQLAALVVVALAPLMFDATFEQVNLRLLSGTVAMLAGSAVVVLAGRV